MNPDCPAKIKARIGYFASRKAMDIEGLGDVLDRNARRQRNGQRRCRPLQANGRQISPVSNERREKSRTKLDRADRGEQNARAAAAAFRHRYSACRRAVRQDTCKSFRDIDRLAAASVEELRALIHEIGPTVAESVYEWFRESAEYRSGNSALKQRASKWRSTAVARYSTNVRRQNIRPDRQARK